MSFTKSSSALWCRVSVNFQTPTFGQKRFIQNRTVAVQLKQAVKGLGNTGEVVQVNPGRMRRLLFPSGQATYVPWKRRSEVTKAMESSNIQGKTASAPSSTPSNASTPVRLPLSYITSCISSVPDTITISQRTSGTSSTLFGSVSITDIERLLEEMDVPVHELEVRWSAKDVESGKVQTGGRVKETGEYAVEILLKGDGESKVLDTRRIRIEAVEEASQ